MPPRATLFLQAAWEGTRKYKAKINHTSGTVSEGTLDSGAPAGLSKATAAEAALVGGGLWRMLTKSLELSGRYLCRRREEEGNLGFASIQGLLCLHLAGCLCRGHILVVVFSLLDRAVSKTQQAVLGVAGEHTREFCHGFQGPVGEPWTLVFSNKSL